MQNHLYLRAHYGRIWNKFLGGIYLNMNEKAKKFLEEVSQKPELKAELTKAWQEAAKFSKDEQTTAAAEISAKVAQAHGFNLSAEDFQATKMYLLSEDELKAVSGGAGSNSRAVTSMCTCSGGNGIGNTWELYCFCPSAGDGYNTTNNHWRCGCAGGNGIGCA